MSVAVLKFLNMKIIIFLKIINIVSQSLILLDLLVLLTFRVKSIFTVYRYDAVIEAKKGNPPIMPAVMTPAGPLDLSSVLFRNRIIFIGQPINSLVAQRVISQLVTLATIDKDSDILVHTFKITFSCHCSKLRCFKPISWF